VLFIILENFCIVILFTVVNDMVYTSVIGSQFNENKAHRRGARLNLCMSCNSERITKKKIVALLVVVIGVAATIYAISVATKNFAVLALSPLVLGFLGCPLMCAVMGGGIWLMGRRSRNKEKVSLSNNVSECCQHDHGHEYDHIDENHYVKKGTNSNDDNSTERLDNIELRTKTNNDIDPDLNAPNSASKTKFINLS